MVVFVVKSSTRREQEYLRIITTVLPTLQGIATGMANINLRLENIEENQMRQFDQAPNKPRKKPDHAKPTQVADAVNAVEAPKEEVKETNEKEA